jgi:hypothetical protein
MNGAEPAPGGQGFADADAQDACWTMAPCPCEWTTKGQPSSTGGDNSNNSFGTFYEGAIVAGYPSNELDLEIIRNIQAAEYGR